VRLSGHQPVYLPGIILFTKIAHSDIFMHVGHCQASPGTWHNRNQIRNAKLVIPIKHDFGQSINDTQFAGDQWKRKHLRSIEINYGKRPFFADYFDGIAEIIKMPFRSLSFLNNAMTLHLLNCFQIYTPVIDSRNYEITGHKTEMLISMCREVGATEYLSNEGARDYVNEQNMNLAGIKHRWLKFTHPTPENTKGVYDQGHSEFQTNLSAIDLLFNCGPESGKIIRAAGHVS